MGKYESEKNLLGFVAAFSILSAIFLLFKVLELNQSPYAIVVAYCGWFLVALLLVLSIIDLSSEENDSW